jgi:hypothetical protein
MSQSWLHAREMREAADRGGAFRLSLSIAASDRPERPPGLVCFGQSSPRTTERTAGTLLLLGALVD